MLTENNKSLTLYIMKYLIVKTKTGVRQKISNVFTNSNL